MILLLVTIGMLNVGLGFGLAIYFGYGPPGPGGIFESLGPMPPANAVLSSNTAVRITNVPFVLHRPSLPRKRGRRKPCSARFATWVPLRKEHLQRNLPGRPENRPGSHL